MKLRARVDRLDRQLPARPPPTRKERRQQRRWHAVATRFCDLLNRAEPLLSETEREQVRAALQADGDSRGPLDRWLQDLREGRSRLPEMQARAMKALLLAWLHPAVGQPMVCNQCGLEYPRLAGPRGIAVRHLPGLPPQSTAPYQVARLFDACPSCGASRYDTTWPDRVPHHELGWKALDGWVGQERPTES
jgi:hypothetical protein